MGSLRGISQRLFFPGLHAPFLALFNKQQPSCLPPATQLLLLFTTLYLLLCERGVCLCLCVRERGSERERARGRVDARGDGKDVNMHVFFFPVYFSCSCLLTSTEIVLSVSRDLSFIGVYVFMPVCTEHQFQCVCMCIHLPHGSFFICCIGREK